MTKITEIVEVEVAVAPPSEIEMTRRALYGCLDRIRRAGKHRVLTAEFEERLEEHLEVLRQHENNLIRNCLSHLETAGQMRQERDQIQDRLHAVDRSYFEQSQRNGDQAKQIEKLEELNRIAGEELIRVQRIARQHLDDCVSAEKFSDDFSEKLRDAQSVIGHQEQLIVGQRLAIAELHMAGRAAKSAVATLQRLGYTDCGGQLWKPPLGKKPHRDEDWCSVPLCTRCRTRAGGGLPGSCGSNHFFAAGGSGASNR